MRYPFLIHIVESADVVTGIPITLLVVDQYMYTKSDTTLISRVSYPMCRMFYWWVLHKSVKSEKSLKKCVLRYLCYIVITNALYNNNKNAETDRNVVALIS